jgi:uncharacterized membrane protein
MSWILLILACGGEPDKDTAAPSTSDTAAPQDFCADAPVLTWENFGQGLLLEQCQSCHGAEATYRDGDSPPPDSVFFDTYEDAMLWRSRILATTTGDSPTMPPRGGMSELDLQRLELWLRCGEAE